MRCDAIPKGLEFFRGYLILNREMDRRNLIEIIRILEWCSQNMATPIMLHYVLEIEDEDLFDTNRFVQRFKEKLYSFFRERNRIRNKEGKRKRKLPDLQLIYSVEMKNRLLFKSSDVFVPYLHLHLMVVIDTDHNRYHFDEINIQITRALSRINGLESLWFNPTTFMFLKEARSMRYGFLKMRNSKTSIKATSNFNELKWHDLKTELDDAICRASYLCKLDQKIDLPEKFNRGNSFGHTRPPRSKRLDPVNETKQNETQNETECIS